VERQVERILDEEPARTVRVIIHMADLTADQDGVFADGRGSRRRFAAQSAREVLPDPVHKARATAIRTGGEAYRRPAHPRYGARRPPRHRLSQWTSCGARTWLRWRPC
jgi:hypothetical protein